MGTQRNNQFRLKWMLIFFLLSACIDPIDFRVPAPQRQTVIEGMISDRPGPYMVKISSGIPLDASDTVRLPVAGAIVELHDDQGNIELMYESERGIYLSGGVITGIVGHSYFIVIRTIDGKIFESTPEVIQTPGMIEGIRSDFEYRTIETDFGNVASDIFSVYVDADLGTESSGFSRWRFKGIYQVVTNPELRLTEVPPYTPYKDPPACSGYIVSGGPIGSGGLIEKVGDCTCCICWGYHYEELPNLSDGQFIRNGKIRNIKVGEVPVNSITFSDKYQVVIEQMSLSKNAFDFFKLIRDQKTGADDLFQPPAGEIIGNVRAVGSDEPVIGLFWATAIQEKSTFIRRSDVPYPIPPMEMVTQSCTIFPNSTNIKPESWE